MRKLAVVLIAGIVVGWLAGCGGAMQRQVIGNGPVSVLFQNTGGRSVHVVVRWVGREGQERKRHFQLESGGQVDLHTVESEQYEVRIDAGTDTPSPISSDGGERPIVRE